VAVVFAGAVRAVGAAGVAAGGMRSAVDQHDLATVSGDLAQAAV